MLAGVVTIEESLEDVISPGCCRRCFSASSAASLRDIADPFLCAVLN